MKKFLILLLFFVALCPSKFFSVSAVPDLPVCIFDYDDQRLIEEGNAIIEEIRQLEQDVKDSETVDEVMEVKGRMERLLKNSFKKYEKDIARLAEKLKTSGGELKELCQDIEKSTISFFKTVSAKLKEIAVNEADD